MKTDGFAKGYGAAAGYEYGHDAEHGTKKYGYDQNGDPYYDDSYYHEHTEPEVTENLYITLQCAVSPECAEKRRS